MRKPGRWIGLWGVVAACVRPEALPGLDEAGLAGAASGVLFVRRPEGGVDLIPGDRDRWAAPEPMALSGAEQVELWLYRCGLEQLQVARARLPSPEPDPRPTACLEQGAPCPLAAYALDARGWASTETRRQPWAADGGDPGRCARPGPVASTTVTAPGSGGVVHFLVALGDDRVLLGARDELGPGRSRQGLLQVHSVPIGEPLVTWTGPTTFISGVRRDDGRVHLIGSDGSTAIAEWSSGSLAVTPQEPLPTVATSSCTDALGREMSPTRGGAMGHGGGETWLLNNCGVLLKRTDDTPWTVAYRPTEETQFAGPDVALLWVGPGEVYASDVERAGVLHYRAGVPRHEPSEVGAWSTTALVRGDDGRIYAGNFFGELTREEDERWRRYGVKLPGAINSLAPVGDGFFVGYGVAGIPQIQRGQFCADDYRPAIPSGFARTLLRLNNAQIVALLVGEPGWIASAFDYQPCSPNPEDLTP